MRFKKLFFFILINFLFTNQQINEVIKLIHEGEYDFSNNYALSKIEGEESLYLKGLIELDGERSKDYFLQSSDLELDENLYTHEAVSEMSKLMDQIDEIFIPSIRETARSSGIELK